MPAIDSPIVLALAYAAVNVGAMLFFLTHRDAGLKRRLYPGWLVANGAALTLAWALRGASLATVGIPLVIAVAAAASLRTARFCDHCGRMAPSRGITRARACPGCGDDLDAQSASRAAGFRRDPRLTASRG